MRFEFEFFSRFFRVCEYYPVICISDIVGSFDITVISEFCNVNIVPFVGFS